MALAMFIFGTLGPFINNISFPSSFIAFSRAVIGTAFILLFMLVTKHKTDIKAVLKNLKLLIPSGIAMGFNWICLFEAYKYTGVAVATLCYYMAPVIVIILSPFILKEKFTKINLISSACAVIGAVLISGVVNGAVKSIKGIVLGLTAAVLYSSIVIMNKFVSDLHPLETTLIQLASAAVTMLPYIIFTENISDFSFDKKSIILTSIVGILHTGIAYVIYFGSVQKIPAQTTAVFSYIDPVTAIIISTVFLNEKMTIIQIAGTILILGATLLNEIAPQKRKEILP
ncbi:MAG: EamA family transporter [Ruminococcus sp.]|nr:EamA family transporter [Candidatus Copronaster equi]